MEVSDVDVVGNAMEVVEVEAVMEVVGISKGYPRKDDQASRQPLRVSQELF